MFTISTNQISSKSFLKPMALVNNSYSNTTEAGSADMVAIKHMYITYAPKWQGNHD